MPITTINALLARTHRFWRGGIVPYTIIPSFLPDQSPESKTITFYCFGLDTSSGDVTDLSGKVDEKYDRDILDTAIREFTEETLGAFGPVTREDVLAQNAETIYDGLSLMIFVYFEVDVLYRVVDEFERLLQIERERRDALGDNSLIELSMIFWLSEQELRAALTAPHPVVFYYPTGRLLVQRYANDATNQCP